MVDLFREMRFALTENIVRWTLVVAILLSGFSLFSGLSEVQQQRAQLTSLKTDTAEDQSIALAAQSDAGGAAYYAFHLTYDPPSELAFAALGLRDELPWKHRLRMLALEGQVYETDSGNPDLSQLGKLDFAYVISMLLPLLLIGLLYDLDARERRESRFELLCATSKLGGRLLLYRACARAILLFAAIVGPFIVAGLYSGVAFGAIVKVMAIVTIHILFWLGICRWVTTRKIEGITAAVTLFGVWLLLTSVVPVSGKFAVEQLVKVPNGGEILLTQRETVNDAWDLPKQSTMIPFVESHPQWRDDATVNRPFEWKWYFAFQQVGDQQAEPLSTALYQGIADRHKWMGWVSVLSPPLLTKRWLTNTADTDIAQHLRYIACVRDFHAKLRHFHYPMLFERENYSVTNMAQLPQFEPCTS